jgi:hypothetical protein
MRHPVLHPRHKLEYFRKNNWDDTSIDAACDIVQDEYDRSYWLLDVEGDENMAQVNGNITVGCSFSNMFFITMLDTGSNNSRTKEHVRCPHG